VEGDIDSVETTLSGRLLKIRCAVA